ncbi:hypothetical protein PA598K_04761 [Paenibacillus sp. 598K]|uniref:hypothetical protein n=1 Tax=Paenibacillus sp. 598K TaxID=1117987 RepID=UPI000FFA47DC|nr:hypothetical protein [Paenibacillus sp. 598K]GBF76302.1 hypothetical protein PA598K_04761 [Paenibacillus sp. 598K]
MSHRSEAYWRRYAETDKLSREERDAAEAHLYECDACLALYMQAVEQLEVHAVVGNEAETQLKAGLRSHPAVQKTTARRRGWTSRRRTLVHYTIAAALTLFLLSSGVWQHYLDQTAQPGRTSAAAADGGTISEQMMARTTELLQTWKSAAGLTERR